MSSRGLFVQLRDSYRGKNCAVDISLVGRTDIRIPLEENKTYTVRDLITMVCKQRNMAPKSVDLFGLALDENGVNWLSASRKVDRQVLKKKLYFLLRFKVFQCDELQQFDESAFLYYLSQCRKELRRGKYAKILDSSVKEMLRMVILEAVLVAKDKDIRLKDILPKTANDKKGKQRLEQFLSREVCLEDILQKNVKDKTDIQQSKKIVEKSLERFTQVKRPEIDFLKELDYIKRFSEEHFSVMKESRETVQWNEVFELRIRPEGVQRFQSVENKIMTLIKTLEFKDILSLEWETNPMGDTQIRLVPEKGIPEVFVCEAEVVAESICSLIDGYYRLLVNHNESLFKDVLPRVPEFVHGPIDRAVAEVILNRTAESGVYLVRESGQTFGHYVVSCRTSEAGICHYKVNVDETDDKCWIEGGHRFAELRDLLRHYHNATDPSSIFLRRNLRPSVTGAVPLIAKGIATTPDIPRTSRGHREPGLISLNKLQIVKTFRQERYSETSIAKIVGSEKMQPFLLKKLNKEEVSLEVFREVFTCYSAFEHRNVVELLHVSWPLEDEAFFCLGFEYSELGSLDKYVTEECETISYGRLLKFFCEAAHGMSYITKDMLKIHGNLRARNLIVFTDIPEPVVKISDAYSDVAMLNAGLLENKHFGDRCNWYAPEILEGEMFSAKSDAWSFGMTMWEVLAQQIPYGRIDVPTLRESLKNDILPSLEILPFCSEGLRSLFLDLWKKDARERHDFQGIGNTLERIKRGEESRMKSQPYFRREDYLRKREELNRSFETTHKPDKDALDSYHKIVESGSVKAYAFNSTTSRSAAETSRSAAETSRSAAEPMEEDEEETEPEVPYTDPLLGNCLKEKIPFSASFRSIRDKIPLPRRPKRLFGSGKGEKSSKIPKHDQRSSDEDSLRSGSAVNVSMLELSPSESCGKPLPHEEPICHTEKETSFNVDTAVDAAEIRRAATPETNGRKGSDVSMSSSSTTATSSADSSCSLKEKREIDAAYALASIAHAGQDPKDDVVKTKRQTDPPAACEDSPGMVIDVASVSDSEMILEQVSSPANKSILELKKTPGIARCNSAPSGTDEDIMHCDSTKASMMTTKTLTQIQLALNSNNIDSSEERGESGTNQSSPSHGDTLYVTSSKSAQQRRREIKESARKALRGPNAFNITAPLPSDFFSQGKKQYQSSLGQSPDVSQFLEKSLVNNVEAKNSVNQVSNAVADSSRLLPILKVILEETRNMNRKEVTSGHYQQRPPLRSNSTLLADTKTLTRDFASLTPNSPQPLTDMQNESDTVTSNSSTDAGQEKTPRLYIANNKLASSSPCILTQHAKDTPAEVNSNARPTNKAHAAITQQLFVPPVHISTVADSKRRHTVSDPSQVGISTQPMAQNPSVRVQHFVTFVPQPKPIMASTSGGSTSVTTTKAQDPQRGDPATLFSKGHAGVVCKPSINLVTSQPEKAQPLFIPTLPAVTLTNEAVRPSLQQKKAIFPAGAFTLASNNFRPNPDTVYAVTAPTAVGMPRSVRATQRFVQVLPNVRQFERHSTGILRPAVEAVSVNNLVPVPRFTNQTIVSEKLTGNTPIENPYKVRQNTAVKLQDIVPANNTCALGNAVKREPDESNDASYEPKKDGKNQARLSSHEESKMIEKFRDRLRRDTKVRFILDKDLKIEKVVGQGYYGVVKKGDWFIKGQGKPIPVAIKMLKANNSAQKDQMLEDFQNEAMNMAILKHDNIVRLLGIHVSEHDGSLDLRLITEWMPNNSLEHFIFNRKNSMDDFCLLKFAYQIAAGMKYLSDNNLVHRDLAARNVLVVGMDLVKISDFGLSRVFQEGEASYQARIKGEESTDHWPLRWYAPESIKNRLFTLASDVWSYGITFWEIFKLREIEKSHAQPYEEIAVHEVIDYLERGNRLARPCKCPQAAWELAVDCWKDRPNERPSFYVLYLRLESLIQEQ